MQAKKIIVLLCLFFANSYTQQQAPVSALIPGLPNDTAQLIPFYIVKVIDSYPACLQTLQCLSETSKLWYGLVRPEENKVRRSFSMAHKLLGFALSEKFNLTPLLAVALGVHTIGAQVTKHTQEFNNNMEKFNFVGKFIIKYSTFSWPHQCLAHAIRQNKKDVVVYLCSLSHIDVNDCMDTELGTIPLLAGAILYNNHENDLTIIECLLKAGADIKKKFTFTANNNNNNTKERIKRVKSENYTPLFLAQDKQKYKIVAKLMEYSEQFNQKVQEFLDKFTPSTLNHMG